MGLGVSAFFSHPEKLNGMAMEMKTSRQRHLTRMVFIIWLGIHYAVAFWVARATPEGVADVGSFAGDTFDHDAATLWATPSGCMPVVSVLGRALAMGWAMGAVVLTSSSATPMCNRFRFG